MIYRKEKKKKYIEVRFYVLQKYEPSKIKLEFSLKWSTQPQIPRVSVSFCLDLLILIRSESLPSCQFLYFRFSFHLKSACVSYTRMYIPSDECVARITTYRKLNHPKNKRFSNPAENLKLLVLNRGHKRKNPFVKNNQII